METIYGVLGSVVKRKLVGVMRWLVFLSLIVSSFFGSTAFAQEWLSVRFQYTCDGTLHENQTVMWRHPGETFQFLPYEPFCEGKTFAGWADEAEQAVDENTKVDRNMVVHAVFEDINLYWVTMEYWYQECPGGEKVFDRAIYLIDGKKIRNGQPFVITSPSQTSVSDAALACPGVDASEDIFYPEQQSVSITSADLDAATVVDGKKTLTKRVKYVPYTATYSYVYKLKNLTGNGYTEIDRVDNVHGVLGSTVTADVKTFPYANLESANPTLINRASGQEIEVKYTRKTFQLIFNTDGGSSVSPMSGLYGSSIAKSSFPANPTRTGYDFAGWYTDAELTQPVGNSVTLNDDVNLYAKWTGKTVNYTIVYMREKYNNATNTTEWVYDRSDTRTATVNSNVSSSSAPNLTNNINGYERDNTWNESITVKADGSSVLTVRYKLKRYTFVFNANGGTIKMNGSTFTGSDYVVTDLVLGMDASSFWPSSSNEIYRNNYSFAGWNDDHTWSQVTKLRTIDYEYFEKAKNNIVTWTAQWSWGSSQARNVEYYFQQPDGTYVVEPEYTEIGVHVSGNLSAKEFDGYTIHSGTPSGYQGNANNACVTITKMEYSYVNSYTDNGGHPSSTPESPTMVRDGHTYTFMSATAQTQNHSTSGHASATPSVSDREIVVGNLSYHYVGNTPVEHTHTTPDHVKQTPDESERTITYDGHTWQFKSYAQDGYLPDHVDDDYIHYYNYTDRRADNTTITIDGIVYTAYDSERQPRSQVGLGGHRYYKYYYRAPKYTYTYAYTDYTYNYTGTTYTYKWICREGGQEKSYTECGYTYRFYYDREKKNIVYYDGSTVLKTKEEVMVGANINTNEYNYVPEKPAGKEDYTWGGWYAQSALVDLYAFGVMPSENLALYAKWIAPQYTVRFEWNFEGADEPFAEDVVDKNAKVNDPGNPNRPHYVFDGWYTAPTGGRRYILGAEQVTSDITLYAKWKIIPLEYTVRYLSGGPGGEPLFEEKNVRSQVLLYQQVITEEAITIAGYLPDASAKTVTLDYDKANNVIEFYYRTKPTTNKYKVRFVLEENSSVEVHAETEWEEVDGNMSYITVSAKSVDKAWMADHGASTEELGKDYYPEEVTKIFQLGSDGDNNIFTIYYRDYECVTFNLRYVDVCGNPIPALPPVRVYIQPNTNYEFSTMPTGYSFLTSYVYDGLEPEPEESHQISGDLVFWDAPNGPTTLNVDAVFQKILTITANPKNKTYDGSPLSSNGVEDVEVSGLEKERLGHTLSSIEFDGQVTNVGEDGLTTPKNAVINGVDCDKEYYLIDYVSAPLNILPAEVLINFDADRWNDGACYDGSPRTIGFRNHGSEIRINNTVYESQHRDEVIAIAAAYSMTETDAGTYTMSISEAEVESQLPNDPNYNVSLAVRSGELTICKAPLTINTSSATKEYDGEELTESTVTIEGLINNQYVDESTVTATATGSQTEVGESVNTYEINWGDVNPNNYVITEDLGTLKVTLSCEEITLRTAEDATGCTVEYTPVAPQENNVADGATFSYKLNGGETVAYPGSSFAAKDGDRLSWSVMIDGAEFSSCEQTIRVEDGTKPVITLDASSEPDGYDWGCNPTVIDPKFTYSDNCEGTGNVPVDSITTKQTTSGCQVTKTWTAHYTDGSGNTADSVSVMYSWKETSVPTLATTAENNKDWGCNPTIETPVFTVSDNCAGEFTLPADSVATSGKTSADGCNYTQTWTATYTSACGQSATPVVITYSWIEDKTDPVITPSVTSIAATNAGSCKYTVPNVIELATISDNCTADDDLQISQSPAEGEFITENTPVTITVVDGCNNKSEQIITVTVPEDLNGTITSFESFCYNTNDGVIEGTIEGGSAPYTVSWTGAADGSQSGVENIKIENLPDGDYIVTVTDVNGCHIDLNATIAQLTQTITLTADSETKVYDGEKLTLHGYTGADNLEPGDVISDVVFSDDSKITNVGEVANTITSFRIMRGDKDVTCYYDTTMVPGLLKVTKRQVTLTSLDSTKFYDRTELIRHEVVVSGDGFAAGEGATYDVTGSQKLVGSSENEFTYTLNDGTLADNYDITVVKGTLEVKANVTNIAIASASKSWTYDCGTHKHEVYTVTYGTEEVAADESGKIFTLPTGDKLTIAPVTEGVKYVSDTEERNNTFTYTLENDDQYAGTRDTTYGTLSITRRPITITAKDSTKVYDAIALTRNEFFTNGNEATCDNVVSVVIEGSQLNVGQSVNKISDAVIKSGDEVVTDNYDITYVDGTLEVTPLDVIVTITGHTNTRTYNGKEQTVYGYDWKSTDDLYNTADYFTYAGDSVAAGTTVGTYEMGLKNDQFKNTNNNFNVTFNVADGWLTINRLDVIVDITGRTGTVTYNGVEQAIYGYEWDANTDLYTENDFTHQGDSVAAGTTIGTYPMGLEIGQFKNVNENFTVDFNLISDGWLTINKITTPITITAFSSTMVYDGGEMTDDGFSFTRNVLVQGDELYADVEGAITNVGTVPNVVTGYRVLRGTVDVTENYTFNTPVDGKLTVTRRPVTIESATDEKTYDGTPLTNNTITVTPTATGEGFVRGEGARYNVTGTITEIGTVDNTFSFTPYSNTDTANYAVTVKLGTLTINKIETPIAITANSNSKMYDGKPLTDAGFTFTEGVLAEGDELQADVVGSITDFGTVANMVTGYKVVRGDLDVTKNYTFGDMLDGTLSITKRSVTITSASGTKVYDRTPLTNGVVSVSGDGFADFEGALFYVTGTITEYGRVANVFTYELKSNTKADNYVIDTVYGTLSITKRPTAIVYNYGYDNKADTLSGFADEPYTQMADPVRTGYDFKGWDDELPALLPLDTLTVTAQWDLITYEIQLDTFETITYTVEDHKVIDLDDYIPYYEGHDFMGWRDNNGNIVKTISTDDASSMDLTATWHIATYYITYISNGKTLKTVPVVFADPIPAIADPVREGYTFSGWSPAIPETMPEGGLTVTAQWGLVTYKLTLEDEGNVVGVYEYTVEDEYFFIDKIEDREGMRFDGWTLNGVLLDYDRNEDKYIFFPALIADNVSISAKWTTVTNEFNLIYKVDGVTYQNFVINAGESTAAYVASVLDPADKRGYKFNGWDMDVPEVMPRRDMVINAVWKPVVYYITLKDENGEELERINYTIEELVQLPTYPEKDGQVFLGWSDGLNTYYEIKPGSSAEDFELTATWGVKSFEIIYIVDGVEYARDTIQAGAPLVKISDPETTEEGYAFSGWSATPDIMPAHDLTVTGSFELGGYTLTYIIDGEVVRTSRYLYGAAISPAKAPSRMGYEFDVWEGLPATMPAHDLSVTGTYKIATYSIVLRNEGVAIDTIYYTIFDDVITLPVIDGPGKMFKGWYDGRRTVNRINPNEYSGNIDLVASWIYFNFTVTFYVDDAQYSRNNSMRYGDVIQLPEEPTKEGLYFIRWDGMPADGLMPENDLKLYAVFSDNPDDVGVDVIEDVPTVDVYTGKGEIVVLRAENMDIQVMNFDGVTLFRGVSNAESFSIPVRYRGAYIVRINNLFRKVLVK